MEQVLRELQPLYSSKEVQETPDIWIIRGEFNILARISEMLSGTKRELMIALTKFPSVFSQLFIPDLLRLKRLNALVKIMVTAKNDESPLKELHGLGKVKVAS